MPSRASELSPALATALGLLHGPAELLPISSSAHISLLPWLFGSGYGSLDDEVRKGFEVALHAGTAAALMVALRAELGETVSALDRGRAAFLAASALPPALVGYLLERPIERRLGTPGTIALGLAGGGAALALADRRPQRRTRDEADMVDGAWLGVAQASALFPGVSRSGATLTAARWRGFRRPDAGRLSREVALPVIAGASGLKALRLYRRGLPEGAAAPLALGAVAAFASTLGCRRLIGLVESERPLAPFAVYRVGLAATVGARLWRIKSTLI